VQLSIFCVLVHLQALSAFWEVGGSLQFLHLLPLLPHLASQLTISCVLVDLPVLLKPFLLEWMCHWVLPLCSIARLTISCVLVDLRLVVKILFRDLMDRPVLHWLLLTLVLRVLYEWVLSWLELCPCVWELGILFSPDLELTNLDLAPGVVFGPQLELSKFDLVLGVVLCHEFELTQFDLVLSIGPGLKVLDLVLDLVLRFVLRS
jgi:hypothetical protein